MERTPEHIDDIFRKRLQDAAPPPPAFVWDNVERELRKRKRRLFFWVFSVGIGLAGIFGIGLLRSTSQGQVASNVSSKATSSAGISVQANTTTLANEKSGTGISSRVQSIQKQTTPKAITSARQSAINVTPLPSNTNAIDKPPVAVVAEAPVSPDNNPQKTFLAWDHNRTGDNLALLPLHQTMQQSNRNSAYLFADNVRKTWPELVKSKATKARVKRPVKNCYDFAKQPSAWLLEAYAGPSLAQRELFSSPDDKPYLNRRLSTEHRNLAFNAGVRASLMLKGNFLIRTGVQYDQMTEVFEYIDPNFVKTSIIYFTQNGMTTIDTVIEYGEKYQKTYNRFGMLDIPLLAGVELRKGRSGFNINAGMTLNVLFWKRGAILSPDTGTPVVFTPGKPGAMEVFRPRAGLSATASVQWFYHVKPRLRVFVEPYFKQVMGPLTMSSHPVEQRYGIGGIRFGLTKILN